MFWEERKQTKQNKTNKLNQKNPTYTPKIKTTGRVVGNAAAIFQTQ